MSNESDKVRQRIHEMHQRLEEENYYELLGVSDDADEALIGNKFRQLAKQWHVDRFSGHDLGDERKKLQEIFSTLNAAHRTLTHPDKRAEYDMEIDDGPGLGAILDAENLFRKGKNMLQTGSYRGAHEMFREATELNPDEKEFRAHFLYTEYLLVPKDEEGHVTSKKRALEIYDELDALSEEMPEKDWLLAFLGTVSLGLNRTSQAEELFHEALMINSQNTTAKRQLRLIKMRRNRGEKGFFGKLMEKIRGG